MRLLLLLSLRRQRARALEHEQLVQRLHDTAAALDSARRDIDALRAETFALHQALLVQRRRHRADLTVLARHAGTIGSLDQVCAHEADTGHRAGGLDLVEHLLHHSNHAAANYGGGAA